MGDWVQGVIGWAQGKHHLRYICVVGHIEYHRTCQRVRLKAMSIVLSTPHGVLSTPHGVRLKAMSCPPLMVSCPPLMRLKAMSQGIDQRQARANHL